MSGINHGAARYLADQCNEARHRQDEADINLRPVLRSQVDRNKWTEASLHVGDEENEPIEAAQASARRRRRLAVSRRRRAVRIRRGRRLRTLSNTAGKICAQEASPAIVHEFAFRFCRACQQRRHSNGSGSSLPSAPRTTMGLPSWYSGAALTWSRVRSSEILAFGWLGGGKCRALQSTAILRLPTPRKPPKSITAARTRPL